METFIILFVVSISKVKFYLIEIIIYMFKYKYKPQLLKFHFSAVDILCVEKLNRNILIFFKSIKNFYTFTAKTFRDTLNIGIDWGSLKELKGLYLKTDETMGM